MPSFSKLLSVGTLLASSIIAQAAGTETESKPAAGKYHLSEKWHADTFLKHIKFFHAEDPTNGYVNYVDQQTAEKNGLFKIQSDGSLYMGVDHTTTLDPNGKGRDSVRIESKMYYNYGLYVADVAHMPGSICGAWPAFWSVGPKWPENGEVDIIEGVNMDSGNEVVLHTGGSCKMTQQDMTGELTDKECGLDVSPIGCKVKADNGTSGTPFNKKGGGYYAMERTTDFIKIWYFPRGSEPQSLVNGSPDTSTFGKPMAHMQGACDFGEHFTAQKLVFNTDFCGDWAGGIFGQDGQCPMTDSNSFTSCKNFVAKNPEEFKEAYWKINSVQIFAPGRGPHALGGSGHHSGGHPHPSVVSATTKEVAATTHSTVSSETTESPAETTSTPPSTDLIPESAAIPPSTDLPVPAATSAPETTSTPPSTDLIPAETTAAEAPASTESSAPASHGPPSKPMTTRRSTVYQTSTTTICTESSSSKAAVMAVQQSSTSVAQDTTFTPTSSGSTSSSASEEEQSPATTSAAAVHGDLVTEYSTVAVSSTICPGGCSSTQSTPVGADAMAASSPTSAVQHAAQTPSFAADTYEVVAAPTIPASTQEPDTKPTSSSTPDAPPSHAAAVKVSTTVVYPTPAANRGKSSSSPVISSPAASSPAASSSSLSRMHGAEQDPSSSSPSASGAMFTGAAGRLSGVSTGVIGVVTVVVFFV